MTEQGLPEPRKTVEIKEDGVVPRDINLSIYSPDISEDELPIIEKEMESLVRDFYTRRMFRKTTQFANWIRIIEKDHIFSRVANLKWRFFK